MGSRTYMFVLHTQVEVQHLLVCYLRDTEPLPCLTYIPVEGLFDNSTNIYQCCVVVGQVLYVYGERRIPGSVERWTCDASEVQHSCTVLRMRHTIKILP